MSKISEKKQRKTCLELSKMLIKKLDNLKVNIDLFPKKWSWHHFSVDEAKI